MIQKYVLERLSDALDSGDIPPHAGDWAAFQAIFDNQPKGVRLARGQNCAGVWVGVAVSGNDIRWYAERLAE